MPYIKLLKTSEIVPILVRHGIIDSAAFDDPNGYDNFETVRRVLRFCDDLNEKLMQNNKDSL